MKTTELKKIRKVCSNCNMNALHTNRQIELTGYGQLTYSKTLNCENCGQESK